MFPLILEFASLFVILPLLIYNRVLRNLPISYLLVAALASFLILQRAPGFQSSAVFSLANVLPCLSALFLRDALCLLALTVAVRFFAPELLFSFVKRAPAFWLLVLFLYPMLSVFPQELLYRAFLFRRYEPLFGHGWLMIVVCALAFGFVHSIFRNWLAVALCVLGGFLFAFTYLFFAISHAGLSGARWLRQFHLHYWLGEVLLSWLALLNRSAVYSSAINCIPQLKCAVTILRLPSSILLTQRARIPRRRPTLRRSCRRHGDTTKNC